MSETLAQIGESELHHRLRIFMPKGQIDDDTADLNPLGKQLLINTDMLVEGIHFSKQTMSPKDIGWKGVAANISDLACSGLDQVLGITVGLVAPPSTTWSWVEDLYKGINKSLTEFGGQLLGGDCSNGKQKTLAITAIGTLGPLRLHRSFAQPGDIIIASGPHGLSRLGLAILQSDARLDVADLPESLVQQAINTHQRPIPPLKALQALIKCKPKNLPWRAAGTDSSDGLLEAVNNLCKSSNTEAIINYGNLPKVYNWPKGTFWDEWCTKGGEDFELVLCLPPQWADAFLVNFPNSYAIGIIKSNNGSSTIQWNNGKAIEKSMLSDFKHFI